MSDPLSNEKNGFSLVEAMVAITIMAFVITGSLVSMGQVSLLSEKSRKQAVADFYLRTQTEQLRSMEWIEVKALNDTTLAYEETNSGSHYPYLQNLSASQLTASGMSAKMKSQALNKDGETGKIIFRIAMDWADKTGKIHEESRVLIIIEGGFSAR